MSDEPTKIAIAAGYIDAALEPLRKALGKTVEAAMHSIEEGSRILAEAARPAPDALFDESEGNDG